jgi:hypothetical protein
MGVDRAVWQEGCEENWRSPQNCAFDNHKPARQIILLPLQNDTGKQQVRSGAADIDTDSEKLEVFLFPDRPRNRQLIGFRQILVLMVQIKIVHAWLLLTDWNGSRAAQRDFLNEKN